jgi:HSP20 family protein
MKLIKAPTPTAVQDEFDRFLDRMFQMPRLGESLRGIGATIWHPRLDFSETDKEYVVRLEAAGIPKDDLEVNLEGQTLTLAGRRHFEAEQKGEEYFWREREEGRFVRSVQLPSPVLGDQIDARYADGVLTVRLPKAQTTARTAIKVK